jgi:hypothetical protein
MPTAVLKHILSAFVNHDKHFATGHAAAAAAITFHIMCHIRCHIVSRFLLHWLKQPGHYFLQLQWYSTVVYKVNTFIPVLVVTIFHGTHKLLQSFPDLPC